MKEEFEVCRTEDYTKLKVVLESSEEGGYSLRAVASGCVSEGEGESEALENNRKAIDFYFERWMTPDKEARCLIFLS